AGGTRTLPGPAGTPATADRGEGRAAYRRGSARAGAGHGYAATIRPAPCGGSGPGPGQGPRRCAQLLTAMPSVRAAKARRPRSRLKRAEIGEMFERLRALNPAPTTELEFDSPYELLVAVALSAQSTDVGVNKATRRLFPVANTPAAIAAL